MDARRTMPAETLHKGQAYRRDIDGLRALAVLPILFNHVGLRGFGGGYVGVDIFFVISGYLITGILVRDNDLGTFSIASFYRRRILRIFPALFAMLAAVAIISLPILMPGELYRFAKSVIGTTFFFSNFVFYMEAGYFDTASHTKPLLHTWSLGIEEQFYILWPLLIALAARSGRRMIIIATSAVVLLSFAFAVWQVSRDMTGAFYLLPSRAWELGLGGLAALVPAPARLPRMLKEALALIGAGLTAFAIWRFFPPIVFPGPTALVPCVGTVLLLLFAPGTIVGRALSIAPATFVGQISYSLYLWHWPVIVLTQVGLFLHPTPVVMLAQIIASFLLAILSWRYIERPFRPSRPHWSDTKVLRAGGMAMACSTLAGLVMLSNHGLSSRFTVQQQRLASYSDQDFEKQFRRGTCFIIEATDHFDRNACLVPNTRPRSILLVGDSMAAHYWTGLRSYQDRYDISQATMAGCRPNIYPADTDRRCEIFFRDMLLNEASARRPSVVIVSGDWQSMDMALLRDTLGILRRRHVPVLLIGPLPKYAASLPRLLVSAERYTRPSLVTDGLIDDNFAIDREMAKLASDSGIRYYSPIAQLCAGHVCRTFARDGVPLQFDYGHLTPAGAKVVADGFMPEVARMTRQAH